MKQRKAGKRYRLLVYQRAWDRLWKNALLAGILLGGLWGVALFKVLVMDPLYDTLLFIGAVVAFGLAVLTFLVRGVAYVQPRADHLRLVTPIFQLKIGYRRIHSVRPAELRQVFPPQKVGWNRRNLLEPFYGITGVMVELNGYPLKQSVMRFFLPDVMLSPHVPGLVLVVKDWIMLSTEIDSFRGSMQPSSKPRVKTGYGLYEPPKKKR